MLTFFPFHKAKTVGRLLILFTVWWALYRSLEPAAEWFTYSVFSLEPQSSLAHSVQFFLYDLPKIFLLLMLMIYLVGIARAGIDLEWIRQFLVGKKRWLGYFLAALFGAVTPFCSCSSIPLFIGFLAARIPLGVTLSFLIVSPLVNEVAIVLLWELLGWKLTTSYLVLSLCAGMIGGALIDGRRGERWLRPFLTREIEGRSPSTTFSPGKKRERLSFADREQFAFEELRTVFRRVAPWVVVGVGIGAFLHGYVPQEWFGNTFGGKEWWTVPTAVAAGIPLYTNVTGVVPIMESLLLKGVPVGTTIALCMSAVVASVPEIIMLKQVMRWQLIAQYLLFLFGFLTLSGWLLNSLQHLLL